MAVDNTLIKRALGLKPQEKLILIEALVSSLDKPDPEIAEEWLEEAKRRLKAHREGRTIGISEEKVFGEVI